MDVQSPKPPTLESQLIEYRERLRDAANLAEKVERKIHGPQPAQEFGADPLRESSVQFLLDELNPSIGRLELALRRINESLGNLDEAEKPCTVAAKSLR